MYILTNFRQTRSVEGYTLIGETRRIDLTPGALSIRPFSVRDNSVHNPQDENAVEHFRQVCKHYASKGELVNLSDFDVDGSGDPFGGEASEQAEEAPKQPRRRRAAKPKEPAEPPAEPTEASDTESDDA